MTESECKKLRIAMMVLVCALTIAQILFFPSGINAVCNLIVAGFSAFIVFAVVRADVLKEQPISSLQILTFWLAAELIAVVGTLSEGMALVEHLDHPIKTFSLLSITGIVLVIAQRFSKLPALQFFRRVITVKVIARLGLFRVPTGLQPWIMGGIGLAAMVLSRVASHGGGDASSTDGGGVGVIGKFIQGFMVFAYVPYVIPFLKALGRRPQRFVPKDFIIPGIYFLITVAVAMAANGRGIMALPIVTVIFTVVLLVGVGLLSIRVFRSKLWLFFGILGLVGLVVLSDLAFAMQAARAERGHISGAEMAALSLEIFTDKQMLDKFRESTRESRHLATWDETYVSNVLLSRFMMTKFHDLSLGLEEKLGPQDRAKLADFNWIRILSIYPAPIVNLLPLGFHKSAFAVVSSGDFMYFLVTGTGLGGFRTGSFIGEGLGMWGWVLFPMLAGAAVIIFILSDALVLTPEMRARLRPESGLLAVPFVVMVNIYMLANLFQADAFDLFVNFIIRSYWQTIVLYALIFFLTKPFSAHSGRS